MSLVQKSLSCATNLGCDFLIFVNVSEYQENRTVSQFCFAKFHLAVTERFQFYFNEGSALSDSDENFISSFPIKNPI